MRLALAAAAAAVLALALPAVAGSASTISYACSPAPEDCTGWYREPVRITWTIPPEFDVTGCDNATVSRDTTGYVSECHATNGFSVIDAAVRLRVDQTPPAVTGAAPARPPDHDGWYTSPVAIAFSGTDATSGIASCTSVTYAGPPSAAAVVPGTCTDVAGNVSPATTFGLQYDATPPAVKLAQTPGDRQVALRWTASADTASVRLERTPADRRAAATTTVFRGKGTAFTDRRVANGRRYRYRLTAVDAAGNAATAELVARPGRRLLSPKAGARMAAAPMLTWTPVRRARYYNVQLFHGRRKLLSRWPRSPRYQLPRLGRGTYTWYVWPGKGRRSANRYGALLGRRTFSVR